MNKEVYGLYEENRSCVQEEMPWGVRGKLKRNRG